MNKKKELQGILTITIISLISMYIVDSIINPGYLYKSLIKIFLFLLLPIIYSLVNKNIDIINIFKVRKKKDILKSIILGLGIYIIIVGAYFILKEFIVLDNIKEILEKNVRVNKDNFIGVAIYISFINSLLEEFFFRGFILLSLLDLINRKGAYLISALLFALYHIAIMANWFSPPLFVLAILGLFVGGLIFNYLNEKNLNIYSSWLVHMMANFAINTIGLIMFEII